jgi:hypothetical protein
MKVVTQIEPGFRRVLELPMAASRGYQRPAIRLDQFDGFTHLHDGSTSSIIASSQSPHTSGAPGFAHALRPHVSQLNLARVLRFFSWWPRPRRAGHARPASGPSSAARCRRGRTGRQRRPCASPSRRSPCRPVPRCSSASSRWRASAWPTPHCDTRAGRACRSDAATRAPSRAPPQFATR